MTKRLRTLARAAVACRRSRPLMLAGCKTTSRDDITASIPNDYRQRHPIAVREKTQRSTVFIGDQPRQPDPGAARGSAARFAGGWRAEASGGIIIDVPVGDAERARRDQRSARNPLDPCRDRRAGPCHRRCSRTTARTRSSSAPSASTIRRWPRRPGLADCGRTTSARRNDLQHCENKPYWNLGCAIQRNLAAHGRQSRPISCSRAAKRRPTRRAAPPCSTSIARAKHRRRFTRMPTKARSATSANDQVRTQGWRSQRRSRRTGRAGRAHRAGAAHFDPGVLRTRPTPRPPCRQPAKTAAWPRRI